MRNENEVVQMFEKHRDKCLAKRLKDFLGKSPRNCIHNQKMRVRGNGVVGFCQCPGVLDKTSGPVFICDSDETAQKCSFFQSKNTREEVVESFEEIISSPTRCGDEYPKLAVLIWVLMKDCCIDLNSGIRQCCGIVGFIKRLFNWR